MTLIEHAKQLLLSDPDYLKDAREGAAVGNTIVGSVMSVTTKAPRRHTEEAVRKALALIDEEAAFSGAPFVEMLRSGRPLSQDDRERLANFIEAQADQENQA